MHNSNRLVARPVSGKRVAVMVILSRVAVAAGGAVIPLLIGHSFAQQPQPLATADFQGDGVYLSPEELKKIVDAAKTMKSRGECPRGQVTVFAPNVDPGFAAPLAAARRDALASQLGDIAKYFTFSTNADTSNNGARLDHYDLRDREPPKLQTESTPPKGTKVTARQKIVVTMVARDDTNRWQSGIQTIQLLAESDGDRSVAAQSWPAQPRTCEDVPPPRRLVATYEVPANPPPVIRLRALTQDHAGNHDTDLGEFPTGDWFGRLTWTLRQQTSGPHGGTMLLSGELDLTLDYDAAKGNLTGRITGHQTQSVKSACPAETAKPGRLSAGLVGSHTPAAKNMSLWLDKSAQPQFTPPHLVHCAQGKVVAAGSIHHEPHFSEVLRNLRSTANGGFESGGKWNVASPVAPYTVQYTLALKPAAK